MDDFFSNLEDINLDLLINRGKEQEAGKKPETETTNGTTETVVNPSKKQTTVKKAEIVTNVNPFGVEEEEETEEVKRGIEDSDENDTEIGDEEESAVKMISSFLKEKGVAEFADEEFRDDDEFIAEIVSKSIDKKSTEGIQAYKDSLPEEIKQLIENYEDGAPIGALLESEQKVYELSTITPDRIKEDSRLQEQLVESFMLTTGWSKQETDDRIAELQDAGIIEKEAIRAHSKLIQIEKANKENAIKEAQARKAADAKKYQEQLTQLQNTIKNKKEFFEGLPTNDVEKKAVFEAITKYDKTGRNKVSQLLSDPETYIKTVYFLEVLKGDISKLKKVATTSAVKATRSVLDGNTLKEESRFGKKNLAVINNFLKSKKTF